ncbi:MAG: winged helix-turn-helix domain-containing protein [Chthonomonas sp.]|nr:winged helix-turn-helix domain-containing protein [Chthonomonas sp.]
MGVGVSSSALWKAHLFGQFRVEPSGGGSPITRFESRRAIALLAYLILHDQQSHSREVLADRIWPETDPVTGRNRLKQTLASLRRLLEPPGYPAGCVFAADRTSIGLVPGAITSDYQEMLAMLNAGDTQAATKIGAAGLLPDIYDEWLDDLRLWVEAQDFQAEPELARATPATPASATKKRIPASPTPFVGRESEVKELLQSLASARLVTATGFGGIGKTRLTMEVGHQWAGGPVLFVPLAESATPSQGFAKLAEALGTKLKKPLQAVEELSATIGDEPLLLILDNLEQLVGEEWAEAMSGLLANCAELRILASSRIPLGVQGEHHVPVYPLATPGADDSLEQISAHAATQLFIDRARRTRADFQITERNVDAMRELLQALAGVPLALELCAAWAHVVSPRQMVERLSASGEMLTSRRRDAVSRQRSLHDAFATTLNLITPGQRQLLTRLSVFRGGCTLELAQLIGGEPISLSDLSGLLDAALIRRSDEDSGSRYWMLESLRDFVQADEAAQAQIPGLNERFVQHFGQLAQESRLLTKRLDLGLETEIEWIEFLDAEWENFTAAVQMGLRSGNLEAAGQICMGTDWHWVTRARDPIVAQWIGDILLAHETKQGQPLSEDAHLILSGIAGFQSRLRIDYAKVIELLKLLGEISQDTASKHARAEVLYHLGQTKMLRTDPVDFFEIMEESARLFRECGLVWREGMATRLMGTMCINLKEYDRCDEYYTKADALFLSDGRHYSRALMVFDRARVTFDREDYEATVYMLDEIRLEAERYGDIKLQARTANLRGIAEEKLGRPEDARASLCEGWGLYIGVREVPGALYPLSNLASLQCRQGELISGLPLASATLNQWRIVHGMELVDEWVDEMLEFRAAGVARFGKELTDHLWRQGESMSIDEITAFIAKLA